MKGIVLALALVLMVLPAAAHAGGGLADMPGALAYIEWVIDGDSMRFRIEGTGGAKGTSGASATDECRMWHYNAPEMTGPERPEGIKAKKKLIALIAHKRAFVRGTERDRYGRLLCEVRLTDGTYINEVMREFLKDYPGRDKYLHKEGKKRKR